MFFEVARQSSSVIASTYIGFSLRDWSMLSGAWLRSPCAPLVDALLTPLREFASRLSTNLHKRNGASSFVLARIALHGATEKTRQVAVVVCCLFGTRRRETPRARGEKGSDENQGSIFQRGRRRTRFYPETAQRYCALHTPSSFVLPQQFLYNVYLSPRALLQNMTDHCRQPVRREYASWVAHLLQSGGSKNLRHARRLCRTDMACTRQKQAEHRRDDWYLLLFFRVVFRNSNNQISSVNSRNPQDCYVVVLGEGTMVCSPGALSVREGK